MKERHAEGLGVRKSADVISLTLEEKLFSAGLLGDSNPMQLLNTVIYMIGMHCALRGGIEHNRLRRPGCNSQIVIEKLESGKERLVYTEDPLQKTNQGGLVSRGKPKRVVVYPSQHQLRCPVFLYKKYVKLLPNTTRCSKLYLRVRKIPQPNCWYGDQPYGFNKIKKTIKELCKEAGFDGHFTNHSLRASCATRMYDNDVPEQVIKEVTGHRSECVRTYKRTSEKLKEVASRAVSGGEAHSSSSQSFTNDVSVQDNIVEEGTLSIAKMLENVEKTKVEMRKKKYPKARLMLSKKTKSNRGKVTIDVNLNMNVTNSN